MRISRLLFALWLAMAVAAAAPVGARPPLHHLEASRMSMACLYAIDAYARVDEQAARRTLEAALDDVHQPWTGGPLAELARRELASHADAVTALLDEVDQFAATEAESDVGLVVTHGEPHPGNLIRTADGLAMVDWDTVALARPERDLWMLADDETLIDAYERLTERNLDRRALSAHRLMWSLTDLAAYTLQLRREHQLGADSDRALAAIRSILDGDEPQPYGRLTRRACPG